LNKDRHCWSATCNPVAASKLHGDFTNFQIRREAESSIRHMHTYVFLTT